MNRNKNNLEAFSLSRLDMEDAIERLFAAVICNERLVTDVLDALTPADVSRQEVAFNVTLAANKGLSLPGRIPTKSLLKAKSEDSNKTEKVSPNRQASRSFLTSAFRQLAAIACYFAAIFAVGVFILTREVGLTAALPLALKTCASKSLVAAFIGPWIQRLTGVSPS